MENIVQSNNRDLRLVAVKVGVLSTLRLALPDVPANATRVEVIVTNGDTHTAYGAHLDTDTERWLVDVAAAQFPSCGKQKYEIAYLLDGKQFWDGAGLVTVEDATTGGLTPSPSPDPARYVVTRINGYGAPNPDGEVRIPRTFVVTEDPTTTDGFIEFDQLFNRITGSLFVLCSVGGALTWVQTAGEVLSVNGMVGDVVLTADDVLDDAQKEAANSGIKADLVPKVLTVDESAATKKIVLGDKAFTSFAELTALVQNGVTRLKYYVTDAAGRPVLYTAHLCDASTIRFDATGTLGETVYTRSIAITKNGDDGIAVSVGALTQVAKQSDIPLVSTTFTEQDAGKAADAKAVGEALAGKVDNVDGVIKNTLTVDSGGARTVLLGNSIVFVYQTAHGESSVAIMLPMKEGTFALTSDIADATKLTPVFSEWTLGDYAPYVLIRNISATYDEAKKGWETTEELSSDGGQTWNEYTVLADENPDPDKTATSIKCISATFIRTIVGYTTENGENLMSGTDDAKAALFAGADFIAAVKKYGGTQIKEDEKGFYYEVDEEA